MRRVTETNFCPVCVEGLWLRLLERVDLIDSLSSKCSNQDQSLSEGGNALSARAEHRLGSSKNLQAPLVGNTDEPKCVDIQVNLVPLAQFRQQSSTFLTHDTEHEQILDGMPALGDITAQGEVAAAGRVGHEEVYIVEWRKDGDVMEKYTNSTSIQICTNKPGLSYFEVMVKFVTDEVRMDEGDLLVSRRRFTVLHGGCSDRRSPFFEVLRDVP
ncbi:hypothetical protein FRC03_008224 [Tulasnella sp. 419]|nr:hypothetical protein FRC03_008224 [Tulasnella sp. 419]